MLLFNVMKANFVRVKTVDVFVFFATFWAGNRWCNQVDVTEMPHEIVSCFIILLA